VSDLPCDRNARESQSEWAKRKGIHTDHGYVTEINGNLRRPLSAHAEREFSRGSGSEIKPRPPKMCALHSSAALVVNVFDFWRGRSLTPLLRAMGVHGEAESFEFEAQLRTGARGIPPNLDVLFHLLPSGLLGVESKFTEWMSLKSGMKASLTRYVAADGSFWSRADMPECDRLVRELQRLDHPPFKYLDIPQLLKHALGLKRAAKGGTWYLRYVYLDCPCAARADHQKEIADFSATVGSELNFRAQSYQSLLASLDVASDPELVDYLEYLRDRYLTN
jgi:hypothetical protein